MANKRTHRDTCLHPPEAYVHGAYPGMVRGGVYIPWRNFTECGKCGRLLAYGKHLTS